MIENRELTMDDYLAMLRRRLKVILIPTLLAPLVGFRRIVCLLAEVHLAIDDPDRGAESARRLCETGRDRGPWATHRDA